MVILKKLIAIYRIGGIKLISAKIRDKLSGSSRATELFYKICCNASEKDYGKILGAYYYVCTGKELNLANPKSFTEKIQWLKLNDTTRQKTELSDKYLVRNWIEEKIGTKYLIPLFGSWDSLDDVDFSTLPDSFVIKTNNGSGTNIIVQNKEEFDIESSRRLVDKWLKTQFAFKHGFELQYKSIQPKVIIEKYIQPQRGEKALTDFKFYCFGGRPVYCQVITGRKETEYIDFFDMDWKHMEFVGMKKEVHNSPYQIDCPSTFEEMKRIASILSAGFIFVRVDLYNSRGNVLFGEMTFTPSSGLGVFVPDEWDYKLGEIIKLPL